MIVLTRIINMRIYTKNDIKVALSNLELKAGDSVLVRSDLRYFGMFDEGTRKLPAAIFNELAQLIDLEKGTIIVPTGSLSLCNTETPFNPTDTKSELGAFSEYVRTLPEAIRSFHPFFSYTAIGKKADYFCTNNSRHAFGPNSPKDRMIAENIKFISLGASPNFTCSTVHHAEFVAGVPYRYVKEFLHPVIRENRLVREPFYMYVTYLNMDIKRDKNRKIWAKYRNELQKVPLGSGFIYMYKLQDFYEHCIKMFQEDIYIWLENEPAIRPYNK